MAKKHIGSGFHDFLEDEGLLAQAQAVAISRVLAFELEKYMTTNNLSKSAIARQLHTSRSTLDRYFDPENTSINLNQIARIAEVMGKKLEVRFT